ncbi:arabinogalactan oligomer/maltooligosaccharide transport system permease protein [Croceifilum oryzae]|uniref:Arabinogalactan oligomer/maltooligosaccharide transport system permease protein n=1 Tax=Croceifilum oryzae TaxID=1553429 RepID=A0AAJ1TEC6_9BACL|nr:carbohydrate ABC transporter permease [Croceifilum oryzae]MDQ0417303.1 arabinogalactan oligomer/maltooligosaccharide transport system permease protein [Croceifilum oryzae]
MRKSNKWVHILLGTASFISIFPILWLLLTSFKPVSEIYSDTFRILPKAFTLENYVDVLTRSGGVFWTWLLNSIMISLLTTVIGLILSTTAAYAISRFRFRGRKGITMSFLFTQMFPGILLIIPLYLMIDQLGLLNTYLGVVLAYLAITVPFCVMVLKNFFDTIPIEIEEAARMDGCSQLGIFWRMVLPHSLPGLAIAAFYSFLTTWNEFIIAVTFLKSDDMYTLPVGLQQFVNQFNTQYHLMAAAAIIITVPTLLLFFFAQRLMSNRYFYKKG